MRGALLGLVVALVITASLPYVRTTDGAHCLRWPAGQLSFSQSLRGYSPLGDAGFDAVTRAWETWQAQMQFCGNLTISEGPRSASRYIGLGPDGGTENLILFRTVLCSQVVDAGDPCLANASCGNLHDCWDHASGVLALTTVTSRREDGVIVDADIEFNAAQAFFTAVDAPPCDPAFESLSCVANDTQATATHEFGHTLGLDESADPSSTMYRYEAVGETSKRVLDPGSQEFVCDVYPSGRPSQDCLLEDGGPVSFGACSNAGTDATPVVFLGLLGLFWLGTRRRRG